MRPFTTTASLLLLTSTCALALGPAAQLPMAGTSPATTFISDVLITQRQVNIFAGFTRSVPSVSDRLEAGSSQTTILAPLNAVLRDLPRKPWEDPRDGGAGAYEGPGGEERADANLRRFTEAHVVPVSPWEEGEKMQTLGGGTVWWERREGKVFVMPGGVEVEGVAKKVSNGEIWTLKGVINYA